MDGVAKTSLLVAAMRAVESRRSETEGRLFEDPFAETLAGDEGFSLLNKAIAASGDQPAIAIRTKFIDDKVNEALATGIRQIVILAAGMDARPFRMDFPKDTSVYELDRKEVLAYKQNKLKNAQAKCLRKTLGIDLGEQWTKPLLDCGFTCGEQTLWLVEGLLMYLEQTQVINLFGKINSLAVKGDILLCDILTQTLLEAPYMKNQLDFLASIGAPWKFGENEPESFLAQLGWTAELAQAGEVAPKRWPFPTAPRNVPNVPRGFYVRAKR